MMMKVARPVAAVACVATLLYVGGCGDGGDGDDQLHVDVSASRQALRAVGLIRSNVSVLIALRSEDSAVMSVGSTCVTGDVDSSCRVENRRSILEGSFDYCRVPLSNGQALTADGSLRIETSDVGVCITERIPDTVGVDLRYDKFEQVLTDPQGTELVRSRIDGSDGIMPTGSGCAGRDIVETFDATIDQTVNHRAPGRLAADGLDTRVRARGLQLTQTSTGVPCERSIVAGGEMDIDDRAGGNAFSQTLHGITLDYIEVDDDTLVRLHGSMTSDCVGDVTVQTIEPLRIHRADECPTGGVLQVTVNGRTNTTTFGAQGQLGIEGETFAVVGSDCAQQRACD